MPRRGLHRARRSPPARRSASRRLCVLRPLRGVLRGLLRGYYEATTRLLRGYYEATTRLLRGYYEATTWLLRGYYEATTRPLPGYYEATTRLLPGAARAPLGQQHSSGSTARLPAPLVLLGSSKLASTIRTPNGRSRGGRSPRAAQVGQIWRPSTPHPLVQPALVPVVSFLFFIFQR